MSLSFEEELRIKGFILSDNYSGKCHHLHGGTSTLSRTLGIRVANDCGPDEITLVIYYQDCECCNRKDNIQPHEYSNVFGKTYLEVTSKELKWFKHVGCLHCTRKNIRN